MSSRPECDDGGNAVRQSLEPKILHAILDDMGDAVAMVDEHGRFLSYNRAARQLAGIGAPAENLSQWAEYLGVPVEGLALSRALAGNVVDGEEIFVPAADGSAGTWLSVTAKPLRGSDGDPSGAVAVLRDISSLKKFVEALRESEHRFATFMRHLPGVAFIKDTSGRYVFYNEVPGSLFANSQQFLGKTDDEIFPPEFAAAFKKNDETVLNSRMPLQTVELAPHEDGVHSWEVYKFPLIDENGEVAYVGAVGIDITEQRQLEAQLRHSQKMEAIGRLAGGVAHDFNNLLTVITGYGHMLLNGIAEEDPLHDCVEELLHASNRAAGLTNQLLAFSRRQIIKPKILDVNDLVGNMDRMLRRVIGEHIHLETSLSSNVGTVLADAGQLEQVIMNLTVNARDAMPEGGTLSIRTANEDVPLHSHRHSEVHPGCYVTIEVADTGCGIDAETLPHLFEPFYTSKEVGKGTGLGLSTVYGIIKQSGGEVVVESQPGSGTVFRIYFPRQSEVAESGTPVMQKAARAQGGTETILLVEDEAGVRQLVREMLRALGYNILEAASGEQAIRLSTEFAQQIDLLLTDVIMPRMSGRELAQRLLGDGGTKKVLFMSGYTDDMLAAHRAPGDDIFLLQKPFDPDALARKVREVLDTPATRSAKA